MILVVEVQTQSLKNDVKGKCGKKGWETIQDGGTSSWLDYTVGGFEKYIVMEV